MKWYDFLAGKSMPSQSKWLYILLTIPFIGLHFKEPPAKGLFIDKVEFINFQNETVLLVFKILSISLLLGFIFYYFINRNKVSLSSFLSVTIPSMIHIYIFLFAIDDHQVFYPLMIIHGVTYISIISLSLKRLNPTRNYFKYLLFVILFSFTCAWGVDYFLLRNFELDSLITQFDFSTSIIISIFTTPILLHYFIDAYIWKKTHPDFKKILKSS